MNELNNKELFFNEKNMSQQVQIARYEVPVAYHNKLRSDLFTVMGGCIDSVEAFEQENELRVEEGFEPLQEISSILLTLDRSNRSERKIDKVIRHALSHTEPHDLVTVEPYREEIGPLELFVPLVEMHFPDKGFRVSLVRFADPNTCTYDDAGAMIPNKINYMVCIDADGSKANSVTFSKQPATVD